MKREEVLRTLAQHREELTTFGVRRLTLFGSVARDRAGLTSDVDLLVEFDGVPTFDRYVELSFYLESLLRRPVDLITYSSLHDPLRTTVEQDAIDVPGLQAVSR